MGDMRNAYKIFVGKPEGKGALGVFSADVKIISEWILGKQDGKVWTGCM
jgi:hypothetical protein